MEHCPKGFALVRDVSLLFLRFFEAPLHYCVQESYLFQSGLAGVGDELLQPCLCGRGCELAICPGKLLLGTRFRGTNGGGSCGAYSNVVNAHVTLPHHLLCFGRARLPLLENLPDCGRTALGKVEAFALNQFLEGFCIDPGSVHFSWPLHGRDFHRVRFFGFTLCRSEEILDGSGGVCGYNMVGQVILPRSRMTPRHWR